MSEEANNNIKENIPSPVKETADPPRVVKEAEIKLKEMSRKAKERKNVFKQTKVKNEGIYFWYFLGGLGAIGLGYIILRRKKETPKRPVYSFVSKSAPVKDTEEEKKEDKPSFQLNCF